MFISTCYHHGMKLKDYLTKKDLSQAEFSEMIGVSQPFVSQLVNGERLPSLTIATKIRVATKGAVTESDWIDRP